MAEQTKIQWTDRTASPWHGCAKVAAGCENCYAEVMHNVGPTFRRGPCSVLFVRGDNGLRGMLMSMDE